MCTVQEKNIEGDKVVGGAGCVCAGYEGRERESLKKKQKKIKFKRES